MVDRDVILSKVSAIKKHLGRIKKITKLSKSEFLKDSDMQDITSLKLQIAIQACIDIGNHIYSEMDIGVPGSYSEIFYELGDKGIINTKISETMIKMVGLRNRIVHGYEDINSEIIYDIIKNHLSSFDKFIKQIISSYNL